MANPSLWAHIIYSPIDPSTVFIEWRGRWKNRPRASSNLRWLSSAYNHHAIESKWQQYWEKNKVFQAPRTPGSKKKYILDMFPYPSGAGLHVGHPEGYTATDILARYWRMVGYDVLHPMGWDAFGLPAEQHAISTGTHPATTTEVNIATFKRQLKSLGFSYDWDRELSTTDEIYVRWTQWIFLQLFKRGLAYQSDVQVNWCPQLGTVLANEEIIDGKSERGGYPVVRMPLRQWVLKITNYADRLADDLHNIDWPEGTLTSQKQWIGKSIGFSLRFKVVECEAEIEVYTTRVETLYGVTHISLCPEHPLVQRLTAPQQRDAVQNYCDLTSKKSDLERSAAKTKTGVRLGTNVLNPLTGEQLPIWVADYVLPNYGTGAVMAVPAHDERDFEFSQIYRIPVKPVISMQNVAEMEIPHFGEGILVNSGPWNGMSTEVARQELIRELENRGIGKVQEMFKLRDWIFSRQRYWGEPIPIYFPVDVADSSRSPAEQPHKINYANPIAVDESELPVKLPPMEDFHPGNDPAGCLARATEWRFFKRNGQWYARETNTMPQWAGSCWYYLRFLDPSNNSSLFASETSKWLPVDIYVGGQEHAVLHLLYARFWHKVLYDLNIVDHEEPFLKLIHQGMILGADGEKMSKSRGNVINPDDIVNEYGADALRLYEMFMGPLEAVKPWQTSQLIGVVRFRDKVYNLCQRPMSGESDKKLQAEIHKTIKKVTTDIEKFSFNTAISSLMIFCNYLTSLTNPLPKDAVQVLLLLISPFAPHVAEECWSRLGQSTCIATASWPEYDESLCTSDNTTIIIQVNGKTRAKINLTSDVDEQTILEEALRLSSVHKYVNRQSVKKLVYVKGKILNIVV